MLRFDEKKMLIKDFCDAFSSLSRFTGQVNPGEKVEGKYMGCLPKKAVRAIHCSLTKDLLVGLKLIDKKYPVFIELPTLKEEGNGMYSEQKEIPSKKSDAKEIIVSDNHLFIDGQQGQQTLLE